MGLVTVASPVLYVHVADDGGVLVIDGDSGRPAWVVVAELARRLQALRAAGGSVLLSRERGTPLTVPVLDLVRAAGVPVVPSREVHPDARRSGGATALMSAAYVGAVDLARDLIDRGADLAASDEDGFSALMYAANGGQDELVKLLLDAGADVNQTDHAGSTPLMFAAQHGHAGIVKKLLVAGANAEAQRADGLTARDFATSNGHSRVAAILLAAERVS
jgi:hypothetical protein